MDPILALDPKLCSGLIRMRMYGDCHPASVPSGPPLQPIPPNDNNGDDTVQ